MASRKSNSEKKAASRARIEKIIEKAMQGVEAKLGNNVQLTLQDCLKVMQLQKELEDEQPTEVTVTWIDPEPKKEK